LCSILDYEFANLELKKEGTLTRKGKPPPGPKAAVSSKSLLAYYQQSWFNPVPIALEDQAAWKSHCAKRLNLYQRHLGIPLALLRDSSVLEFGCNTGENALVLASVGANLTLVEPNEQALPPLKALFKKFGLEEHIVALLQEDIDGFESKTHYNLVLAEGFLFTLPNRDEMVEKIGSLLVPGGLAVTSFNDRYGSLLEMTRRMLLWRACQLAAVDDVHSAASLELARRLYWQDFAQLNASRPFEAWWKDMLVNPLFASAYLWSYPELLPLVERAGCEFYSSSPKWDSIEYFTWYKNVGDAKSRHQRLLDDWTKAFPFFLTGLCPSKGGFEPATAEVVDSVSKVVTQISEYTTASSSSIDSVLYPSLLDEYFSKSKDLRLRRFNSEIKKLYETVRSCQLDDLLSVYHSTKYVRNLWGAPYHYICFNKLASSEFMK
jgi:SAM-dependent methyltransferase